MKQRGFVIYAALGIVALLAVIAVLWMRLDAVTEQRDNAEKALQTQAVNEKVVVKYVERKVEIIKRVPVIAGNLDKLCEQRRLSGAGNTASTASAEADHAQVVAGLAGEIGACLAETEQINALRDVLKPQIAR